MNRNLVDILSESQKLKRKYFYNYKFYCEKIKKIAKENLKSVRVLVFGSVVRNEWQPKSDIDVLIIPENIPDDFEERAKIRTSIKSGIDPFSPFQIHLCSPKEFEDWYKNFLKNDFLEI